MASGRGGRRARRGGRARARALGRPGAGARRPGRRGRVPAARGRADRRSRRGERTARSPPPRPACRRARSTWLAGCWRPRRPDRSTSSGAPGWICCGPRSRSPQSRGGDAPLLLLAGRAEARAARRPPRARDLSRRVGRGAVRRAGWPARAAACSTSPAPSATAPAPAGPPLSARPAARRPGAGLHRRDAPPRRPLLRRAVAAFASAEVSAEEVLRWGWLATRRGELSSGTTRAVSRSATRAVQLARDAGALEVLAVADNALRPGRRVRRRLRARRAAGRGGRRRQGGDREPASRPYAAIALAGLRGREAEASRADRRRHRGGHRRRPGDRRPVRALGERRAHERPRPLRGGARGGRAGERAHAGAVRRRRGR